MTEGISNACGISVFLDFTRGRPRLLAERDAVGSDTELSAALADGIRAIRQVKSSPDGAGPRRLSVVVTVSSANEVALVLVDVLLRTVAACSLALAVEFYRDEVAVPPDSAYASLSSIADGEACWSSGWVRKPCLLSALHGALHHVVAGCDVEIALSSLRAQAGVELDASQVASLSFANVRKVVVASRDPG